MSISLGMQITHEQCIALTNVSSEWPNCQMMPYNIPTNAPTDSQDKQNALYPFVILPTILDICTRAGDTYAIEHRQGHWCALNSPIDTLQCLDNRGLLGVCDL